MIDDIIDYYKNYKRGPNDSLRNAGAYSLEEQIKAVEEHPNCGVTAADLIDLYEKWAEQKEIAYSDPHPGTQVWFVNAETSEIVPYHIANKEFNVTVVDKHFGKRKNSEDVFDKIFGGFCMASVLAIKAALIVSFGVVGVAAASIFYFVATA